MPYWVQIVDVFWPIFVAGLALAVAATILWMRSQFSSTSATAGLELKLAEIDQELKSVGIQLDQIKHDADSSPTRLRLLGEITGLQERLSRMEASNEATQRQISHQNHTIETRLSSLDRYLQILVETGIDQGARR